MTEQARSGIVADIGGTNARFALVKGGVRGPISNYLVADFAGPAQAVRRFLTDCGLEAKIDAAVLAVAGPVEGGRARLTNGVWEFGTGDVARELGIDAVRLVNDFAAVARGLPLFRGDELLAIGGGEAAIGAPKAVLGPGTGLGVALYAPFDGGIVIPTEGGHATLSAEDDREWEIIGFFRERFGHVSAERVLSGRGLEVLYEALRTLGGHDVEPGLSADQISARAIAGECPVSVDALGTFCAMLGGFAGNLALTTGARGGVYIAGGILPKFPDFIAKSAFRTRFEGKGRFRDWLAEVPTQLVMHPEPAFPGLVAMLSD
jgi:glucokinase